MLEVEMSLAIAKLLLLIQQRMK